MSCSGITAFISGRIKTKPKTFIRDGILWLSFYIDIGDGLIHINAKSNKERFNTFIINKVISLYTCGVYRRNRLIFIEV